VAQKTRKPWLLYLHHENIKLHTYNLCLRTSGKITWCGYDGQMI
jgi:hypothetical protein